MFRLLFLSNGWADCVDIWHAIGAPLVAGHAVLTGGNLCTCAREHCASISHERLGRLCSNLMGGLGGLMCELGWWYSVAARPTKATKALPNQK